ncbi:hypothetical protein LguiA_018431 [Lonicera macranthoides]
MVYKRLLITISLNIAPCPNNTCTLGPNGNNTRLSPSLSNVSFHAPSIDLLQAYYRKIPGIFETDFPLEPQAFNFTADRTPSNAVAPESATKVKVINFNSSVEIVFQGTNVLNSAENHPLHLHGYSFYVVGYGDGNFNNVTSPSTYNLVDPPEMNTVAVPRNGWAAVRFKADNPDLNLTNTNDLSILAISQIVYLCEILAAALFLNPKSSCWKPDLIEEEAKIGPV